MAGPACTRGGTSRHRARVLAATVAVGLTVAAAAVPAAAAPAVGSRGTTATVHAALPAFVPWGGIDTLRTATTGATSCSLATVPAFPGGTRHIACGRGVSTRIAFPPNAKSVAVRYVVTLTARGGRFVATSRAAVVVEGSDWRATAARRAAPYLASSISCANPDDCVIGSFSGQAGHLTASGATWTNPDNTLPSAPETGLAAVSCVPGSKDFCVALDYSGNYLVFNGTAWTAPSPLYQSAGTTAKPWRLDCMALPATSGGDQCVAIDGTGHDDVYTATFQSTTTVTATPVPLVGPGRVACATPALCVAVDPSGMASVLSNGVWSTTPQRLDPVGTVLAVSCAPDHGCVATDQHSNIIDFSLRGGRISGIVSHSVYSIVHRSSVPAGVSCPMDYCLVALEDGQFVQSIHGAWDATTFSVAMPRDDRVAATSCATSATTVWCASTTEGVLASHTNVIYHLTVATGAVELVR